MWRRLLSALTVLALACGVLFTATAANAATVTTTSGGVTYRADDAQPASGATVVSVDATAPKSLVLPTTVSIGGTTYDVTSIGAGAAQALDLTALTLPARLRTVGESAFLGNQLTTVVLPGSVTSVSNGAFVGNLISTLGLSSSLQSIGEGAFAGNRLTAVDLPASLRVIDSGAFVTNDITTVVIPASVTVVDDAAFADNPLTSVRFTGPPPTTFTPADGSGIGSLGDGVGLVVLYPAQFGSPGYPGGYTSPMWQGYRTAVVGAIPPTTPTNPPTPPGTGTTAGRARPLITRTQVRRKAEGLTVFRVRVTNVGSATARGVRVIIKNRPSSVTYPKPTAKIGVLRPGASATVQLRARIRTTARTKFIFKALSENARRSSATVRLSAR